jgi:tRNA 5-methylaminomethyl-2-thiouridine biosynthesis bifunctional protein
LTQPAERHALVIGAGLAGAATCAALARRGWHATLVDAADGPARGASALPVGMLSPHVTRAPTPLSRLCALGVPDMRAELERLVPEGSGWQACEVDNLEHHPGRWPAALVRPSSLVNAWLDEARRLGCLDTHWGRPVQRLEHSSPWGWTARDTLGRAIAQAPQVVVAAAYGSLALLREAFGSAAHALPLRPVKGQLSAGALEGQALAERPLRQNGVFVPAYADQGQPGPWPTRLWAMGSTYDRGADDCEVTATAHERNAASLDLMHPEAARTLRRDATEGRLLGWAQVRCASLDRLPLVGQAPDMAALADWMAAAGPRRGRLLLADVPRQEGLHLMTGFGSRGLSLAHWAAQWLASRMDGTPLTLDPQDRDLEHAIDPARFAWRAARRPQA